MGIPIEKTAMVLKEYRVAGLIQTLNMMDLGNSDFLEFVSGHIADVEDCFTGYDECYILPRTKEFAKALAQACWDYDDDCCKVADECRWAQDDNGRYWLYLWWD